MTVRSTLRIRTRVRSAAHRFWPAKPKPLILMYHRIADEPVDPWGLAVSPDRFDEHLSVLRRTRHVLPLMEFVRNIQAGTLRPDAVALTFDDGYADNLFAAKPQLAAADVPATVFLATGFLNSDEPFWWDELARMVLLANGFQRTELVIRGEPLPLHLRNGSLERDGGDVCCASLKARHKVMRSLWQALRSLENDERRIIMDKLRLIYTGREYRTDMGRAMTGDEVRTLITDGLIAIEAHTVTHPLLPGLETATCHREIIESKSICEALIGKPVAGFAYPYGEFNPEVREVVISAGFIFACSAQPGPSTSLSDPFAFPRMYVPNVGGDAFNAFFVQPRLASRCKKYACSV